MGNQKWQRARNRQQIEQRELEILGAAEKIFHSKPYEEITMQMIARETGFSQSNLYRYYKTREEIFLKLFLTDLDGWAGRIRIVFDRELSFEDFVEIWTSLLLENERLLRLTSLLSVSLEKNASGQVYAAAKQTLFGRMRDIVSLIGTVLPGLDLSQRFDLLQLSVILAAGGWPMTQYSETQLSILENLNLENMKIDFPPFFKKVLLAYLRGLDS